MATTAEQINLWRQAPSEHQRLEFKEAKQQFDTRKLNEYCVGGISGSGKIRCLCDNPFLPFHELSSDFCKRNDNCLRWKREPECTQVISIESGNCRTSIEYSKVNITQQKVTVNGGCQSELFCPERGVEWEEVGLNIKDLA